MFAFRIIETQTMYTILLTFFNYTIYLKYIYR